MKVHVWPGQSVSLALPAPCQMHAMALWPHCTRGSYIHKTEPPKCPTAPHWLSRAKPFTASVSVSSQTRPELRAFEFC